jgi:hypothetical protein
MIKWSDICAWIVTGEGGNPQMILANGFTPSSDALAADMRIRAEAPSLRFEELAAVTFPLGLLKAPGRLGDLLEDDLLVFLVFLDDGVALPALDGDGSDFGIEGTGASRRVRHAGKIRWRGCPFPGE